MLYAKVVLGLAVEGPFDYIVPDEFRQKIRPGMRVWVSFRLGRKVGYVVALSQKTHIKKLKSIISMIDEFPVLNKNMLCLAQELSRYYCCSWGEAIESALPESLRRGVKFPMTKSPDTCLPGKDSKYEIFLLYDLQRAKRWAAYAQELKSVLENENSAIALFPDINSAKKARDFILQKLNAKISILYRNQPEETQEWSRIREGSVNIVLGTRAAIFAPLCNLGLVIVDEEDSALYKQDQSPHYHAREAAFMRAKIEKVKLILGGTVPSLESYYLAKRNRLLRIKVHDFVRQGKESPEVKIIDISAMRHMHRQKGIILVKYLEDAILSSLNAKNKVLLFLNRRGFATYTSCRHCNAVLRCPRCAVNLVYHFKGDVLACHYCNFKMPPVKICPQCNSSYLRYSGAGTEKIESELFRLFPQARIKQFGGSGSFSPLEADILIATSVVITEDNIFGLTGILSIDSSLNRADFRSAEKTFALLNGLLRLTGEKIIIQTSLPKHYCFRALAQKDPDIFYREELRQRKQLMFPPYRHMGIVKLRSKKEPQAEASARKLFDTLNKSNKDKTIEIVSVNPSYPAKLRGKFYWQVLLKSISPYKITKFLKICLKDFRHSGIIVTVDIDPI